MYSRQSKVRQAIARTALVGVVIVIIIVIVVGGYAALSLGKNTSTTSSTSTISSTSSTTASISQTTSSSTSSSQSGSTATSASTASSVSSSSSASSAISSSTFSSTSSQSVQNAGRIVYDTSNQPSSLDPALWSDAGSATIQFNVYETLLQYVGNVSSQVFPWLASNYTVSADGLTYTVNLRQGITFQDGSAF
ncbi:MAG: ABC transporter substrate-binding protein, partial [Nitrososphaerales archaeon]